MAPRGNNKAALRVTVAEILQAIESLYADRVRPQGRVLLKRLGERAARAAARDGLQGVPCHVIGSESVPRLDTKHIRRVCERCPRIEVVTDGGSEYAALLVGRAPSFVDACSGEDPYAERLWSEMAAFFGSPQNSGTRLPGGRYACAQALLSAVLPFLAGRSLGEVCHIVQLAITQRRILGYLDGHVVPYLQSEAVVKQQSAVLQQPAWSLKKDAMAVADLRQARECLQAILESSSHGEVPLPNVKRLFRSRFQLELSETALGHCRISDLLQDKAFNEICSVLTRGNTYVVVRKERSTSGAGVQERPTSGAGVACASSQEPSAGSEDAVQGDDSIIEPTSLWHACAERTFIHFKPTPATPARRSRSVPKDLGSGRNSHWLSECALSPSDSDSTEASECDFASPRRLQFCPDEPLSLEESLSSECEALAGCPLTTPSPQYDRPYSTLQSLQHGLPHPRAAGQPPSAELSEGAESNETLVFLRGLGLVDFSEIDAVADAPSDDGDARSERALPGVEPLVLEGAEEEDEVRTDLSLITPSPQYHSRTHAPTAPARFAQAPMPLRYLTTCPRERVGVSRETSFQAVPCASMRSRPLVMLPVCSGA